MLSWLPSDVFTFQLEQITRAKYVNYEYFLLESSEIASFYIHPVRCYRYLQTDLYTFNCTITFGICVRSYTIGHHDYMNVWRIFVNCRIRSVRAISEALDHFHRHSYRLVRWTLKRGVQFENTR